MTTNNGSMFADDSVDTIGETTSSLETTFDDIAQEVEGNLEASESGSDINLTETSTINQSTNSVFATPEFKKYQSSTDKRMAELERQLQQERSERSKLQEQESLKTLDAEVNQYTQTLRNKFLNQGLDDVTAQQMANEQAGFAKEAYLAKMRADQMNRRQRDIETELNSRTQLARAYELSSQYGIPFSDLQDISNPQEMERHAKSLKQIKELEARLQGSYGSQTFDSGVPAVDVAPTNAASVLDRYNAGDPSVTTEMARAAAKKMGYSIFN